MLFILWKDVKKEKLLHFLKKRSNKEEGGRKDEMVGGRETLAVCKIQVVATHNNANPPTHTVLNKMREKEKCKKKI